MSQHTVSCVIVHQSVTFSQILEAALRKTHFEIQLNYAKSWAELETALVAAPALVFCPSDLMQQREERILDLIQQRSPDSICVKVSQRHWEPLSTRVLAVELCAISVGDADLLQQQIDYLLNYSSLKHRFRQCKHLLSIAELRCQWLVDYAREPVAFVARGRHLHANVAYLSLFGFSSESEALATPLLRLISTDEREVFSSLCANAERSACPSNKLLLTLKRFDNKPFRAEIRFIPSVFRGQRCVQLHVHALVEAKEQNLPNPWSQPVVAHPPGKNGAGQKLQAQFQETLNLHANTHASLLVAEPNLLLANGKTLNYTSLVRSAQQRGRFQLDWWNVRSALLHPLLQRKQNNNNLILISLGDWIFKQATQVKALVKLLNANQRLARQLVLAIPVDACLAHSVLARQVLPALKHSGARLALDQVSSVNASLLAQIKQLDIQLVRLAPELAHSIVGQQVVSQQLYDLIQTFSQAELAVIVDGVRDITSLNLLCLTAATYLQGEILNKFTR
ncbi:EAL domain-containing protein [uncultured Thiothrix sp.]|uniref:EAL domain-containing protein n=1 Tax=uncultured Thiothrix sp. TaxID=223185 RepID=UPI00262A57D1|nr:EAL domain-containing protein [uncultured Thiothrix sp.]